MTEKVRLCVLRCFVSWFLIFWYHNRKNILRNTLINIKLKVSKIVFKAFITHYLLKNKRFPKSLTIGQYTARIYMTIIYKVMPYKKAQNIDKLIYIKVRTLSFLVCPLKAALAMRETSKSWWWTMNIAAIKLELKLDK